MFDEHLESLRIKSILFVVGGTDGWAVSGFVIYHTRRSNKSLFAVALGSPLECDWKARPCAVFANYCIVRNARETKKANKPGKPNEWNARTGKIVTAKMCAIAAVNKPKSYGPVLISVYLIRRYFTYGIRAKRSVTFVVSHRNTLDGFGRTTL